MFWLVESVAAISDNVKNNQEHLTGREIPVTIN